MFQKLKFEFCAVELKSHLNFKIVLRKSFLTNTMVVLYPGCVFANMTLMLIFFETNICNTLVIFSFVYLIRLYGRTVNARASCTGGLEFQSLTGQILHSIANSTSTQVALALWRRVEHRRPTRSDVIRWV